MYDKSWYKNLNKSKLTPPSWIFGVVWPILYLLLSVFFILLLRDEKCKGICNPLILFGIQILLNFMWTTVFFRLRKLVIALIMIIIILGLTVITFVQMQEINKNISYLLVPYMLWLSLATYLNIYIVMNN
jgi:translocator protein